MTDDKRAQLEAAIDEDPYDPRAYEVLGDYLQELGDPRGELIALQLDGRSANHELAAAEIIARLGQPAGVEFHYAFGYARSASVKPGTAKGTRDALDHPSGRFLVELYVMHNTAPLAGTIKAIGSALRPTLRTLQLGATLGQSVREPFEREVGDMSALWAAVPRLERLDLLGVRARLGDIRAPQLRWFTFESASMSAEALAALSNATWPRLEELTLICATADGTPEATGWSWLGELLARDDMPALRVLRLERVTQADKLVGILAKSPLLKRLTSLSIMRSDLTDEGAHTIVAKRAAFDHLTTFDLRLNEISSARVTALQEHFENIDATPQSSRGDVEEYFEDVDE